MTPITKVIIHEKCRPNTHDFDIALIYTLCDMPFLFSI